MSPIDKLIIISVTLVIIGFILKGVLWLMDKYELEDEKFNNSLQKENK